MFGALIFVMVVVRVWRLWRVFGVLNVSLVRVLRTGSGRAGRVILARYCAAQNSFDRQNPSLLSPRCDGREIHHRIE